MFIKLGKAHAFVSFSVLWVAQRRSVVPILTMLHAFTCEKNRSNFPPFQPHPAAVVWSKLVLDQLMEINTL
jgi:hypothetical protein